MRQVFIAPDLGRLFLVDSYELGQILPLLADADDYSPPVPGTTQPKLDRSVVACPSPVEASRCVSQENSMVNLVQALIPARRDEMALRSSFAVSPLAALAGDEPMGSGLVEPLSEREIEVLRLVARGLTNKDIAQTLFLSVQTVKTHLHHIFGKLGVRSRTEAAWWATQHGYGLAEQGITPVAQIVRYRGIE